MPLKPCIKATVNLNDGDVDSILESFDSYSERMDQDDAARLAIDDTIESVKLEQQEYLDLIHESHPELAEKPKKPARAKPRKPIAQRRATPAPPPPVAPATTIRNGELVVAKPEYQFTQPYDFVQYQRPPSAKPRTHVEKGALSSLTAQLQLDHPALQKVKFHVFATQDEAFGPGSTKKHGIIRGGFYAETNEAVLIAEYLRDENSVITTLRHELVGHFGFRELLNNEGEFDRLLKRIYKARNGELKPLYDWVAKYYPDLVAKNDIRTIADEMLARAAETQTRSGIIKQVYDQIIKLLHKFGLARGAISMKEMESLVRLSEGALGRKPRRATTTVPVSKEILASRLAPPQPVWVSGLAKFVEGIKQDKAPASQFLGMIRKKNKKTGQYQYAAGVKEEEFEWLGIEEFLDGKDKITKQELLDYINQMGVQIEDVMLGEASGSGTQYGSYQLPGGRNYREALLTLPTVKTQPVVQQAYSGLGPVPEIGGELAPAAAQPEFTGGHFQSHKNILAHVRHNEREVNGEKVLFIEEIQSDWHQAGRKRGYKGRPATPHIVREIMRQEFGAEGLDQFEMSGPQLLEYFNATAEQRLGMKDSMLADTGLSADQLERLSTRAAQFPTTTVADAPFKKTWPLLAMKRMIRFAADNGFDRISWTTGDQQSDRYSLGSHIDKLEIHPQANGYYRLVGYRGNNDVVDRGGIDGSELGGYIGEELAERVFRESDQGEQLKKHSNEMKRLDKQIAKIVDPLRPDGMDKATWRTSAFMMVRDRNTRSGIPRALQPLRGTTWGDLVSAVEARDEAFLKWVNTEEGIQVFEGLDLDVGGHGMRGFYDQMLPKMVGEYIKKHNSKVGMHPLHSGPAQPVRTTGTELEPLAGTRLNDAGQGQAELVDEYEAWLDEHNIAEEYRGSADELVLNADLSAEEKGWLREYIQRWEMLMDLERLGFEDSGPYRLSSLVALNQSFAANNLEGFGGEELRFLMTDTPNHIEQGIDDWEARMGVDVGAIRQDLWNAGMLRGAPQTDIYDSLSREQLVEMHMWNDRNAAFDEEGETPRQVLLDLAREYDQEDAMALDPGEEPQSLYALWVERTGLPEGWTLENADDLDFGDPENFNPIRPDTEYVVLDSNTDIVGEGVTAIEAIENSRNATGPMAMDTLQPVGELQQAALPAPVPQQAQGAGIQTTGPMQPSFPMSPELRDAAMQGQLLFRRDDSPGPLNLDRSFKLSRERHFKNIRELRSALQEQAKTSPINLTEPSAELERNLVAMGVDDATYALKEHKNAVGWYDKTVSKALEVLSLIHPELATDENARFAFTYALAVTSNGMKVDRNFQMAERFYGHFKSSKEMPVNIGEGTSAGAINKHAALFNFMVERHGIDSFREFMLGEFTVGEIQKIDNLKVTGELVDTRVIGGAILGAKIGNGFFANLNGMFDKLTMDRWLTRTWGRWTGTLLEDNKKKVRAKRTKLRALVKLMSPEQKRSLGKIIGMSVNAKVDDVAQKVQRIGVKLLNRQAMNRVGNIEGNAEIQAKLVEIFGPPKKGTTRRTLGDELRKISNGLAKDLDAQKEAPANGTERNWMRQIFSGVLAEMQGRGYNELTMADLQALLWYPEKKLYDSAKSKDEIVEGYEDDEAPDYANAAMKLAEANGIAKRDINNAIKRAEKDHDRKVSAAAARGSSGVQADPGRPGGVKEAPGQWDFSEEAQAKEAPFDPNDPNFLKRRFFESVQNEPTDGNLGMPDETLKDRFVRLAQDNFNRVKKLQQVIQEQGGRVNYKSDVYRTEELSSSKISHRLKLLDRDYMKPLLDIMDREKLTIEELDLYVLAKHAPERNAVIADRNDAMPDGGSGLTNQQAAEMLDAIPAERRQVLENAASIIYSVNDQHLDDLVDGGHLDSGVADVLRDRWENYVPLKGKDGQQYRPGTGGGYSISGANIKWAMGRGIGNLPESPTAHSFAQAESAIVRTEKTKIGQALVQLVRDNPDPNFWTVSERNYQKFEDLFGEPFEGYEEAPEGMIEDLDYIRVRTADGKVAYRLNPAYKNRDDVFSVMQDGTELLVQIKDPLLIEQLKKMNTTQLNAVVAGFGQVNRYLAMINTALNPEFVITNFERDFQTAMINLGGEHSAAIAGKVAAGIPGAIRGIWQATFDTTGQSEWRSLFEEMEEAGGTIGFFGLEDIDTKVKKIQKSLIDRHGVLGRTKNSIRTVRDLVLDANLSVENAARLSAYKVIKEEAIANGLSVTEAKQRAASVAKNLTVNFNRKGELAPVLNSAYLFYNASIQGSFRILTALSNPRVRKIVAGVAATAFALALYNRSMGGDDDDEIPYWDKISDYTKQTNLIIMHPDGSGNYTKIRLPYGYNVFWYAGSEAHDLMFDPRKSVPKATMNMLSATLNAYNPIQGADLLDTLTPTVLKPFEQDVRNINFMGAPLKPENPFDNYDRPESQKAFKSTNPQLKEMMALINEATGGDETHPGMVDISPEIIKHYVSWLTGGAGMTVTRAVGTGLNLASGEELNPRNVPFWRTVTGKPGSHFDRERYYSAVKGINAVEAKIKMFDRGDPERADYIAEHRGVHDLALHMKGYRNRIKRLSTDRDKAYANDDPDLANEKREEIRQEMMEFSLKYEDALEE